MISDSLSYKFNTLKRRVRWELQQREMHTGESIFT